MFHLQGVELVDTFAEAFPMTACALVVTAETIEWARIAGQATTGYAASVIGCDFSFAALRIARKKLSSMECATPSVLVQGDAANLPFASNSFDLVISCETIEHVPDVQAALREMHRETAVPRRRAGRAHCR